LGRESLFEGLPTAATHKKDGIIVTRGSFNTVALLKALTGMLVGTVMLLRGAALTFGH